MNRSVKKIFVLVVVLVSSCQLSDSSKDRKNTEKSLKPSININRIYSLNQKVQEKLIEDFESVSCSSAPNLPEGLTLTPGCVLVGKTSELSLPKEYRIIGESLAEKVEINLNIEVQIPILADGFYSLVKGDVEYLDIVPHDFEQITCTFSPKLPEYFQVDQSRGCQIAIEAKEYLESTRFNIVVESKSGHKGAGSFSVEIINDYPELVGSKQHHFCTSSKVPQSVKFENLGAKIKKCEVNPALPKGLMLDNTSCEVSGISESDFVMQDFQVIASSEKDQKVFAIKLSSSACDAPVLATDGKLERFYFYKEFEHSALIFDNVSSVSIEHCYTEPQLPQGLQINPKTCEIFGRPKELMPVTSYKIYAEGASGQTNHYPIELVVRGDFVSTWEIVEHESGFHHLRLPTFELGRYNFIVDWGDGTQAHVRAYNDKNITHRYEKPGIYKVVVTGEFTGFLYHYRNGGEILDISNFGSLRFVDIRDDIFNGNRLGFFAEAQKLNITAADELDLYGIESLYGMFYGASKLNSLINMDTSKVKDMSWMFANAVEFNQKLNLNTESVENFSFMFLNNLELNEPVEFNTKNARTMDHMFMGSVKFNQTINFDTPKLLSVNSMFLGAGINKPIYMNTSNVFDFSYMFRYAQNFNQPINFDFKSAMSAVEIFKEATNLSSENMDFFLEKLSRQDLQHELTLELAPNGRTSASDESVEMLKSKGWEIIDD